MYRASKIAEMMKHYPYPKSWYKRLSEQKFYGVYQQFVRTKKRRGSQKYERSAAQRDTPKRRYNTETGQWMVLTDIHGWEPESN